MVVPTVDLKKIQSLSPATWHGLGLVAAMLGTRGTTVQLCKNVEVDKFKSNLYGEELASGTSCICHGLKGRAGCQA